MRLKLFQIPIVVILVSCGAKKESGGTDAVVADYTINAAEGEDSATCLLRFYQGRNKNTTLFLDPPAGVSFDGTAIQGDSAGLSGAFYEVQKPLETFAGPHVVIFKNAEGKAYKEAFDFEPFSIATILSETVTRGDILLQIAGLKSGEPIRVLLTDTAFRTADINEIDTVQNGTLTIAREALRNVASGPVTLHLYKEEERPLQQAPAGGGKLSITYGLSREFELTDEK